jgi:hypothetical protein
MAAAEVLGSTELLSLIAIAKGSSLQYVSPTLVRAHGMCLRCVFWDVRLARQIGCL